MLFYDCYEKRFLCVSLSLSLFSHLHRRLICLAISDRVTLTVCCSFPFVCRHFSRENESERKREREKEKRSIYDRQWENERKKEKKYYRNGQSHHLSHVCMCRLTCESILSVNIHTSTSNQSTIEENVIETSTSVQ